MFELGRFITEELKRQGLKRSELVFRLGYGNINKGLRRLDECIKEGIPHRFIIENLHTALGVEQSTIKKVLGTTRRQLLEEKADIERKKFRPHLFIITELSRPTSISMAVITGLAQKKIGLPDDITGHPLEKQLQIVQSVVRRHYKDNQGEWRFFGKILGYYYFHHFQENIRLDVDGNVEKYETTPFEEPEGFLVISGIRISGGLFKLGTGKPEKG